MATMQFSVSVSGGLGGAIRHLFRAQDLPATHEAVQLAAVNVQRTWQDWARGASLAGARDIANPSTRLAASIGVTQTGEFSASVGTSSKHMESIQRGRAAQDMKKTYPYGRKSRVFANGNPYLIVPFRWGTPSKAGRRAHFASTMNAQVYAAAKQLAQSWRTEGTHLEYNAQEEAVRRSEYVWQGRLKTESREDYESGMVRMRNDAGGSTYFTFRIISARSAPHKWIKKAIPPNDVALAVARANESVAEKLIEEGIKADLGIE